MSVISVKNPDSLFALARFTELNQRSMLGLSEATRDRLANTLKELAACETHWRVVISQLERVQAEHDDAGGRVAMSEILRAEDNLDSVLHIRGVVEEQERILIASTNIVTSTGADSAHACIQFLTEIAQLVARINSMTLSEPTIKDLQGIKKRHGYAFSQAAQTKLRQLADDPTLGKHVRGYIMNEISHVERTNFRHARIHMPKGLQMGHYKYPGLDLPEFLHLEYANGNIRRPNFARKLGKIHLFS